MLQKGMVIKCRYNPEGSNASDYILLILQPKHNGMVHALSLKEFNSSVFKSLATKTGIRTVLSSRFKALDIPKLDLNTSSNRFYTSILKGDMSSKYNISYRTLNINNMSNLQIVEYDFE